MGSPVEIDTFLHVCGALAAVGILIPIFGLALRKVLPPAVSSDRGLRVEGRLPLGGGLSLMTVEVGERRYLIAAGAGRAQLLDRLDDAESQGTLSVLPGAGRGMSS